MVKLNKKLSYILVTLILITFVVAGRGSLTSEGKNQGNKKDKDETISVFLNDEQLKFTDSPIIKENKVYVPIDEFAKKIGAKVKFKRSKKIIIKKDDKSLVINTKDNTAIAEDNKTFFINSINEGKKTLLPVDIISKHFDLDTTELSENTINIYGDIGKRPKNKKTDDLDNKVAINQEIGDENTVEIEDVEMIKVVDPNKRIAYLTFDDGPNVNTPQILDVLKQKNVKATFFMLGSSIMEHGDITKRIADEGHALGVHSMTHNFKSVYASPDSFMHEMSITNDALKAATGKQTLLLRAPYGSKPYMKQEFRDLATAWGYRIWDWNVDSKDSIKTNTTPDEVYNEVVNQTLNHNHAVILFHDKEHTLNALPRIIDYLVANGYEIRKLDEDITPLNFWNDMR